MMNVALDVHSRLTQLAAVSEHGEILLELQVETRSEELRRLVSGISGPKRVVFEERPLSGLIRDAPKGVAQEIIAADPARNALIARAEDSTDDKDALRLARLSRTGPVHPVYVPEEPHRTLRSVVRYDHAMSRKLPEVARLKTAPGVGAIVARTTLFIACAIIRTGKEYDDGLVSVPMNRRNLR
jgi:hypothetical protein